MLFIIRGRNILETLQATRAENAHNRHKDGKQTSAFLVREFSRLCMTIQKELKQAGKAHPAPLKPIEPRTSFKYYDKVRPRP